MSFDNISLHAWQTTVDRIGVSFEQLQSVLSIRYATLIHPLESKGPCETIPGWQ